MIDKLEQLKSELLEANDRRLELERELKAAIARVNQISEQIALLTSQWKIGDVLERTETDWRRGITVNRWVVRKIVGVLGWRDATAVDPYYTLLCLKKDNSLGERIGRSGLATISEWDKGVTVRKVGTYSDETGFVPLEEY